MISDKQQIGAKHLVSLALERLPHPIGKEANRSQSGHRNHQRRRQQAQLASASVAAQHTEGKGQRCDNWRHINLKSLVIHRKGAKDAKCRKDGKPFGLNQSDIFSSSLRTLRLRAFAVKCF
jgi:hypothetical protein